MDVRHFINLLIGMHSIYSKYPQIGQKEKHQIIYTINNARRNVAIPSSPSLPIIKWDYQLEHDIHALLPQDRTWLFQNSKTYKNTVDFNVNFNLMFLTKSLNQNIYKDYNYVFHDTCNNQAGDVLKIFRFRINQKHCFDYSNCSPNIWQNFMTCSAAPIIRAPNLPCSWSWRYYTQLIRGDLKSIACLRFSVPGNFTTKGQKDSFGCYGESKKPVNDVPYKKSIDLV